MGAFLARRWPWFVGGTLLLVVLAVVFRGPLSPYVDPFGNLAGVVGFLVSLVGFFLTIWTVVETQRSSERAREKVEQAVAEAQRETRRAVERVGLLLLGDEVANLQRLVVHLRQAAADGHWPRAAVLCQEGKLSLPRVLGNPHLAQEERSALLDGVDDLRRILKHIEDDRLAEVLPSRGLTDQRTKQLDDLVTTLSNVQSRLRQQALEVPHASLP